MSPPRLFRPRRAIRGPVLIGGLLVLVAGPGLSGARAAEAEGPADGLWASTARVDTVSCGPASALARQALETRLGADQPARIVWKGVLDGTVFETAWRAVNPARNAERMPWRAEGPHVQRADIARRDLRASARMDLLAADTIRLEWTVTTRTELTPCTISVTQTLHRIGD